MHFPVDNLAGRFLGTVLGQFFAYVADDKAEANPWLIGQCDGSKLKGDEEFLPNDVPAEQPYYELKKWEAEMPPKAKPGKLSELWKAARKECVDLNLVF